MNNKQLDQKLMQVLEDMHSIWQEMKQRAEIVTEQDGTHLSVYLVMNKDTKQAALYLEGEGAIEEAGVLMSVHDRLHQMMGK